ncbi:MAG TPA: alpha/beta hydrolase [Burkholderiales bacterium]|jgi:pimeloyl-ACP methyl ester carboxylesterase|nr:alpha/beta hydrolase [Burkholderiales bacterium]
MHYVRSGRGSPTLVFVHGFCCELGDWQPQLDYFGARTEVVACDLRGHGKTPGRPEECSIEHYGGDVAALLSFLELGQSILVGHSMGCRVVLEAARLLPERIAGLVLVDGSRFATGDPEAAERAARAAIEKEGYAAFSATLFGEMFVPGSARAAEILARVAQKPADVPTALWPRSARWDAGQLDAALAAVRAPLLAIQSTVRDPVTLKRTSLRAGQSSGWLDLLRERVKGARIEVIPGVGHFTQLDAPERVNRAIEDFLKAV